MSFCETHSVISMKTTCCLSFKGSSGSEQEDRKWWLLLCIVCTASMAQLKLIKHQCLPGINFTTHGIFLLSFFLPPRLDKRDCVSRVVTELVTHTHTQTRADVMDMSCIFFSLLFIQPNTSLKGLYYQNYRVFRIGTSR